MIKTKKRHKKKGGTKSEERRRSIISNAREGREYKYRIGVNDTIRKLEENLGQEYVGPPDFEKTHKWMSKYNELLKMMPELAKKDNDPTLDVGHFTYNRLTDLKAKHKKLLIKNEKAFQSLKNLPSPPKHIGPTKLTGQGKKKKKRSKTKKKKGGKTKKIRSKTKKKRSKIKK